MEQKKHLPLFVVIPANVHFNEKVSDKECRIYGYISALANSKGYCYATNKYLADTFKVSESTIKRAISNLVKENLLKSVLIKNDDGMVIERRLFLILPENSANPQEPHNNGGCKNDLGGGFKFDLYNNINNNNNYSAENSTEHNEVKSSSEKSADEGKQVKPKKSKKDKVIVIKEDTAHFRIMEHFNSKDNTRFKANNKDFVENIDALLITYTEEEIKGVVDYIRECNYNEAYFRPKTIFRPSNFERSYEFYIKWDKKKTCGTTTPQANSQQQLFYFVNKNIGKVIASPIKPNLPDTFIFSTREEAEATL